MTMDAVQRINHNYKLSTAGVHIHFRIPEAEIKAYWTDKKCQSFKAYRNNLFSGEIVNDSEHRAAWHTAFRNPSPIKTVSDELEKIKQFSELVRANKQTTDVVNIGIGGSDLGPKLIYETFEDQADGIKVHFISNLDSVQINSLLKKLSAPNTLFIITSKSFSTIDTLENMQIVIAWLAAHGVQQAKHLVAVTQNHHLANEKYHIPQDHIFDIPEWVGGRFSLWTAVGLSCAIAFGFSKFYELHQGAAEMDQHFAAAGLENNMPVVYATQLFHEIKHNNVKSLAILPYAHRLRSLPSFLQQLFMESLGKHVNTKGERVNYTTGPVVFGGVGTNAQHSFQQLMMQGTHHIVADYILPLSQKNMDKRSQAMMVANCLAQVETLRNGAPHADERKKINGNQIANLFVLEELDFKTLGALIAFYEHAVVTLAFLLDINPFDQWGVEYAKKKSKAYFEQFGNDLLSSDTIDQLLRKKEKVVASE